MKIHSLKDFITPIATQPHLGLYLFNNKALSHRKLCVKLIESDATDSGVHTPKEGALAYPLTTPDIFVGKQHIHNVML